MRMPRPFINLLPGGFRHPGEVACVYHNSEDKLHSRVMCREDKFQGQMNVECRDTHEHTQTHTHTHTHTHTAKLIARVTPVAVKGYICQCRRQQPTEHCDFFCFASSVAQFARCQIGVYFPDTMVFEVRRGGGRVEEGWFVLVVI